MSFLVLFICTHWNWVTGLPVQHGIFCITLKDFSIWFFILWKPLYLVLSIFFTPLPLVAVLKINLINALSVTISHKFFPLRVCFKILEINFFPPNFSRPKSLKEILSGSSTFSFCPVIGFHKTIVYWLNSNWSCSYIKTNPSFQPHKSWDFCFSGLVKLFFFITVSLLLASASFIWDYLLQCFAKISLVSFVVVT